MERFAQMPRHKGFTMECQFYEGYTNAVINDDNQVQCPKCASLEQRMDYEIIKYGILPEFGSTSYLVTCGKCAQKYCFSQMHIQAETTESEMVQ